MGKQEKSEGQVARSVVWLLGPTSSGKTTIAEHLVTCLKAEGVPAIHYDGDEVRDFFGPNLGFAPADRLRVVSTLVHLANKAARAGLFVIVSALTANDDARRYVRSNVDHLILGYVKCSIETCAQRDPKGLYAKSQRGEIDTLVGVNTAYLPPDSPDIVVDTETLSVEGSVERLLGYLREHRLV